MLNSLKPIKVYLVRRNLNTTNWPFKLLCRLNVGILLFFVALMTLNQFFGSPIDCGSDVGSIRKDSIESYCWVMGLYVQKGFTGIVTNKTASIGYITGPLTGERIYLRYYQWLILVYFGLAASFSFPSVLWKIWENGRVKQLCDGLDVPLFEKNWTTERRAEIVGYFVWSGIRSTHMLYALKYFICQVILFIVSIINIWFIEIIFSGFWTKYYHAVAALYPFDYDTYVEQTAKIFPRMAKCEFINYGASGSLQKLDALCLLPLNMVNEKIFTFLFFWLLLMVIVATLSLIWSCVVACSRCLRIYILKAQTHEISLGQIRRATNNGSLGDFFILHLLGKNMNPYVFKDLLIELSKYKFIKKTDEIEDC
uniref:Innexin n=1 Tax=Culicoides sonorensis TaxID=179676 RepID=A0A336MPK5_CULSO